MGSRLVKLAMAAIALAVVAAPVVVLAGEQQDWAGPSAYNSKSKDGRLNRVSRGRSRASTVAEVKETVSASAPAEPARPAAPELAPAPSGPADTTPGLSHTAPETPPSVSVRPQPSGPSPAATPEPATLLLMATGMAGLYRLRRRR